MTIPVRKLTATYGAPASAILVLLCTALFLDGMDVSSMGVTLPAIQKELGMKAQSLQWIVSGYVLGYGGFLLLGGRVADIFGRRKVFLVSMLIFALASLAGSVAAEPILLIAARVIKGVSAGFTGPAALALLLSIYKEPVARHRALGIFSAMGAAGFTLGLVIGGVLGDITWRLTLLLPAIVALAVVGFSMVWLAPDPKEDRTKRSFDLAGAIMATTALLAIVFGATEAASYGWGSLPASGPILCGLLLLGVFVEYQRRTVEPLMPLSIFMRPGLGYASLVAFCMQGIYAGFQFVATLYYQNVLGWSVLQSGLSFAIGGAFVMFGATRFARLALRTGPVPIIIGGMALQFLGYAWFLLIGHVGNIELLLGQQILTGLGYAAAFPALNIKGLAETRDSEHGLASGIIISGLQIGSGIILAITASVFAVAPRTGLTPYTNALWLVAGLSLAAVFVTLHGLRHRAVIRVKD